VYAPKLALCQTANFELKLSFLVTHPVEIIAVTNEKMQGA
jgi:hypothetical protein